MKVKLEDSFDGAFGIPYDDLFTVDTVIDLLLEVPEKLRSTTVSAVAPTEIDMKMKDFERSNVTNIPMFEPLMTNYFTK
jgi:hypothetical protein